MTILTASLIALAVMAGLLALYVLICVGAAFVWYSARTPEERARDAMFDRRLSDEDEKSLNVERR